MANISGSNPEALGSNPSRPAIPTLEDFGILYLRLVLGWSWDRVSEYTKQGCQDLKPRFEKTLNFTMGLEVAEGS